MSFCFLCMMSCVVLYVCIVFFGVVMGLRFWVLVVWYMRCILSLLIKVVLIGRVVYSFFFWFCVLCVVCLLIMCGIISVRSVVVVRSRLS